MTKTDKSNFPESLKAARKAAGLNQDWAADLVGVSKRAYCDWERGNVTPHPYMQQGVLNALQNAAKNRG